ncbi:MAG TPA: HAMP domain-containing sensor histidine kinase [Kofleriaceae bacterium]
MLFAFIAQHRDLLVARAREKVRHRAAPASTEAELDHGVPLFLDQFASRLKLGEEQDVLEIGATAAIHGAELLGAGFTIGQVVHGYGDVCQAVMELASELGVSFTPDQFKTFNMCLDIAIAEAVTEYAHRREKQIVGRGVEQLGFLAHELRNLLNTATLAFEATRSGRVGLGGSTSRLVATSLLRMSELVTESLAEVRLEGGRSVTERVSLAHILEELEIAATMQAKMRNLQLVLAPIPATIEVDGDAQIVASILTNLVQNACKFTREHGRITVENRISDTTVALDVSDECGGLPPGDPEQLFGAYQQRSSDRSGVGLGLAISRKGATALGGSLTVRDLPGVGCVFTATFRRSAPVPDA